MAWPCMSGAACRLPAGMNWVAATPDFAAPLVEETTIAATYRATDSLEPGLYYWRVRGRNLSEACDLAGE